MGKIWKRTKIVVPLQSIKGNALRVWAAAQHSSSELGSAFALHHPCTVNHERLQSGKRRADVDRRKLSLIPCKNTFKHYGKDFV